MQGVKARFFIEKKNKEIVLKKTLLIKKLKSQKDYFVPIIKFGISRE